MEPSESFKKTSLEELSREELIEKCRNLLQIAHKAKSFKNNCLQENNVLKNQIAELEKKSSNNTTEELIENLTQQKFELVSKVDELNGEKSKALSCLSRLEYKVNKLDEENESFKRQVQRLTEENESLSSNIDSLEHQISECNLSNQLTNQEFLHLQKELEESKKEVIGLQKVNSDLSEKLIKKLDENENNALLKKLKEKTEVLNNLHEKIAILQKNNNELIGNNEDLTSKYHNLTEEYKELTNSKAELNKVINEYENAMINLKKENEEKAKQVENYLNTRDDLNTELHKNRAVIEKLQRDLHLTSSKLADNQIISSGMASDLENMNDKLQEKLKFYINKLNTFDFEVRNLKQLKDDVKKDCISYIQVMQEQVGNVPTFFIKFLNKIKFLEQENLNLNKQLETLKTAEIGLAEQSRKEIVKLNKEISKLEKETKEKKESLQLEKLSEVKETQTEQDTENLEETVNILKREHDELLCEMNLMNQELKERGEMISKLEDHCDELMKKIRIFETQSNKANEVVKEKEDIIQKLNAQITERKDEEESELETMSTSTISKAEEMNRLKDLEGPWEEKYQKLRMLAIKLKTKVKELEKENIKEQDEKKKLMQTVKMVQTLQAKCDSLEDHIDSDKRDINLLTRKLDAAALEISNDKKKMATDEELIADLKSQLGSLAEEKSYIENWKKQVSTKIQALRKELEANKVLKKEYESQISKLKYDLEAKDKELNQTKSLLQESNNECKKQSVLNLEMQDYERSLKDLSQRLEKKQEQINSLKDQLDSQKNTVGALKEQNRMLEERFGAGELDLKDARKRISAYQKNINNVETDLLKKDEKITDLLVTIENLRLQNEELSTELSKVIAEHQKAYLNIKKEKDHLVSQNLGLEQRLRELEENLVMREEELKLCQSDYKSYKVRAQSVLKQNQTRDVVHEEKIFHELATKTAQVEQLMQQLNEAQIATKDLIEENKNLVLEKRSSELRVKQLETEMDSCKKQLNEISSNYDSIMKEHSDTIKTSHLENVSRCYKQQLSEQEIRYKREIVELQSKLEKEKKAQAENVFVAPPTTPREEGEGSESVESNSFPVPLERLVNDDLYQETTLLRKRLAQNEAKVVHLTALLADTEQDLAKHVQMNKLLKDEVRRQQTCVERDKHADNLEYLKNVVFKFATLNGGDEKSHLVPVLNTILKFSREENEKLLEIARGEHGLKSWTNYLPTWSSSRPQ